MNTQMINNQKYITNEQITKILTLLGEEYFPKRVIVFGSVLDKLLYFAKHVFKFREVIFILHTNYYNVLTDSVYLLGNKQVNLILDLIYSCRERHYYNHKDEIRISDAFQMADVAYTAEQITSDNYYSLIDKFVANFMNGYAMTIKEIMCWEKELLI